MAADGAQVAEAHSEVFQAAVVAVAAAPLVERVQPLDTAVPVEDRLMHCTSYFVFQSDFFTSFKFFFKK